jgi:(R,R)-butanediol dehydrogenase/meso-butanediol dehydrogenase/diacetyl reductase
MRCVKIRGIGLGQMPGAYAEFVTCGAKSLLRLPDNLTSREGALVEPLSVGLHGVKRSGLKPGAGCIVMGAGPIGLSTLLWCKAKGAKTVVVSELAERRYELAYTLGASAVVNPNQESPAHKFRELTGEPPSLIFECIGVKSTLQSAIEMAAPRARIVIIGVCMEPDLITPMHCILKELVLDFALAYNRVEFQETIDALASGRIDAKPMITDVISVEAVPAMFETLRTPTAQAKVIVEFPL